MFAYDKITAHAIRLHLTPQLRVTLSAPLPPRLDDATMAHVAMSRITASSASGAPVAK